MELTPLRFHTIATRDSGVRLVDASAMDVEVVKPRSAQDQMYLEACNIYLSPEFTPEMTTRLKKMIRMGGGIQVVDYDPSEVTHVVVPSDKLDARLVHKRRGDFYSSIFIMLDLTTLH
jgi:hypothetical protein